MTEKWKERWKDGNTPWERGEVNPQLERYFDQLHVPTPGPVLVPLCGKSEDMWWLHGQGYAVVGVELSAIAVREFMEEHSLAYQESTHPSFNLLEAADIRLLSGNLYEITANDFGPVAALYDRAALDAFSAPDRVRYMRHLLSCIPDAAPMLVVTLEYPQQEMSGPPYSVGERELLDCLEGTRQVSLLHTEDVLEREPQLRRRGVSELRENAFLVNPRTI